MQGPLVSWAFVICVADILGSVYLKSTVNSKNALINAVVSWVAYTWNLQLTCKNALIIPVVSWVVYTWNLQLTCKNALINAVVSWVAHTWNLQLTRKNTLVIPVVSWVVYTWNLQFYHMTRRRRSHEIAQRLRKLLHDSRSTRKVRSSDNTRISLVFLHV